MIYLYIYTHTFFWMLIHIYTHTHIYIYIYIYHTCIYTRTHLQIEWFVSRQFIFHKKSVYPCQWKVFIRGSEKCSSVAMKNAWNVVTLYGHAHPAVTSWFLYSMPDEHLGAVDHARHDSVGVHSVSLRYLVVTQKTGCNSHFTKISLYT